MHSNEVKCLKKEKKLSFYAFPKLLVQKIVMIDFMYEMNFIYFNIFLIGLLRSQVFELQFKQMTNEVKI